MEHITANAVIRHIGKVAGFAKNPHRLVSVEVEGCVTIQFDMGGPDIRQLTIDDEWVVAYDDDSGIITITAADGVRSVYYVHYLPDRYMLSGWLYRQSTR